MADTTEGDIKVQHLSLLVPALISFTVGLVIHSFIIGVNVTDWWKGRSVTPVDHIVTLLGISRLCAQCSVPLYFFLVAFTLRNLSFLITFVIMDIFYVFFTYANMWLTSLLSIVLCLKISNLHTRLFLYLRKMILPRTVHLIVASGFVSAICLVPSVTAIAMVAKDRTYNISVGYLSKNCVYVSFMYAYAIGAFIPLLIYSISSVLLFTSLYHHTTRMKMSSNLSINLETYYLAMRFVSFTFICNIFHFIFDILCFLYYYFHCVDLLWLYIILDFLPLLHSSYLIYRTAKLRDQMSKVLHNVIGFLFQRKDTETRESAEVVAQRDE